jgi:hypothetical protein
MLDDTPPGTLTGGSLAVTWVGRGDPKRGVRLRGRHFSEKEANHWGGEGGSACAPLPDDVEPFQGLVGWD